MARLAVTGGLPTLYTWRRKAREQGILMPSGDENPDGWNAADKFSAVLQTASMNEAPIAEFCRAQGLYPEQIQLWKSACQHATPVFAESAKRGRRRRSSDRRDFYSPVPSLLRW